MLDDDDPIAALWGSEPHQAFGNRDGDPIAAQWGSEPHQVFGNLDDDPVATRWGSELHRVFGNDWSEEVYSDTRNYVPAKNRPWTVKNYMPEETYDIVQSICFSSQMLDEDAFILSRELARFSPQPYRILNRSRLMSLGASALASLGIFFSPFMPRVKLCSIFFSLAVPLTYTAGVYAKKRLAKSRFNKFLQLNGTLMTKMYLAYKNLNECRADFENLKHDFIASDGPRMPDDFFYYFYADHAVATGIRGLRNTTLALINLVKMNMEEIVQVVRLKKPDILAYTSGDVLMRLDGDENISALRETYICFASQMLLQIGLSLLIDSSNLKPVLRILEDSIPFYEKHVESARFQFEPPPEIPLLPRMADFELTSCAVLLSKLISKLTSVWTESVSVKSFIEELSMGASLHSEPSTFVEKRMRLIEELMADCVTTFGEALKLASTSAKKSETSRMIQKGPLVAVESSGSHSVIPVGRSDFSVAPEDQVFFCLERRADERVPELGVLDVEEERPQLPPGLVGELKGALKNRKDEFNRRELEALKRAFPSANAESLVTPEEALPRARAQSGPIAPLPRVERESEPAPGPSVLQAREEFTAAIAAMRRQMNLCQTQFHTYSLDEEPLNFEDC